MSRKVYLLIGTLGGLGMVLYTFILVLIHTDAQTFQGLRDTLVILFAPIVFAYVLALRKVIKYKDEQYIKGLTWVALVSFVSMVYTFSNYWFALFPLLNIIMYIEAWTSARKAMKNEKK